MLRIFILRSYGVGRGFWRGGLNHATTPPRCWRLGWRGGKGGMFSHRHGGWVICDVEASHWVVVFGVVLWCNLAHCSLLV
ncbi:hypothetical protein Hanom_Chr01g00024581 [Helianthus anomalus]